MNNESNTSNALPFSKCQASYYWTNKHKVWCGVRPYNAENPNEIIFADGSKLVFGIPGQPPTVVVPPPGAIYAACDSAYRKGVRDRLGRGLFDPNFLSKSRKHIPKVKQSYAEGWWSVPQWPKSNGRYNK